MTTIAELGIKIDSGDATQAASDLDKLAEAGKRSEESAGKTGKAWESALGSLQGDTAQIVRELQALNATQAQLAQQMITVGRAAATAADGLASIQSGAAQAGQAQSSLASASDGAAQAGQRLAESAEEQAARMAAVVKASLEASQYHQSLTSAVSDTSSAMDEASKSATDWAAYQEQVNARAHALMATEERLAEEARKAATATDLQAEGLQALLGKINPTVAALDKLDEQQAQLQKYKNAGMLDTETFNEYSAKIDATRQKLADFDEGIQKTGVSTAQTQAALRQLPAQFTDIFTSLAGGQNPLLVLIQQGGQIADSFGGIGPTLDLLGDKVRSVLGLGGGVSAVGDALEDVGSGAKAAADGTDAAGDSLGSMAEGANTAADAAKNAQEATNALNAATPPLISGMGAIVLGAVAAAAALAALVYGYAHGSKEADKFGDTLLLTGNRAGKTADQLATLAQQVSDTNGTVGEAAASLVAIANSGTIAGDSFKTVADAAANMEDATGKAVEKTIAEFAKIGKDPVAAAKELQTQYGFLTASVYSQIAALKEQGDTIGAAKLLTDTYANTINDRSGEIVKNLGLWEKGWKAVSDSAKDAVDSIKAVGREQTLADQITDAQRRVSYAQDAVRGDPDDTDAQEKLTNSRLELQYLTQQRDTQAAIAAAKGLDTQRQQAAITAMAKVDTLEKSSWTNAEKRNDALKEYERSLTAIRKADPSDARLKPETVAKVKANIADQFKDPSVGSKAVDLSAFNDAQNQLKAITGYYDNIQKELDAAQKAGLVSAESYASQRVAIVEQERVEVTSAYETQIKALEAVRAKSSTNAEQRVQIDQKIADARAAMLKAQADADTELQVLASNEQGRLKKQADAVKTYTDALQQQVSTLQQQGSRAASSLGMGDRQRSLYESQNGIDDRINNQRLELASQYGDGSRGMSLDEYNQKLAALDKTQRDLKDTVQSNYDQMTAAQGSWSAGASSAFQNYLESARDVAGQTKTLFTSAFSSMEDAIVAFATTGKFSFADFTKSILADMAQIAARQAASSLLSTVVSWGVAAAGSYFGGASNGFEAGSAGDISSQAGASAAGYDSTTMANWSGVAQANGGAWDGGVQFFADGAAFTNTIVSSPTAFGMSGGQTGVMGEAGPEAIMPLTRTAGGQLGVRALSSGGSPTYNVPVSVSVSTEDRSGEGMEVDQQALQRNLQSQMQSVAEKAVADSWRAGGTSYRQMRNA